MGQNIVIMATNSLKIQRFRANDLVDNGGKQFELGRSWCDDFFEFNRDDTEVVINLTFKSLCNEYEKYTNKNIELKLSGVSTRGDRKAYVNGENGRSQIKDFFIKDLQLTVENNSEDYFGVYKSNLGEYYLYFIPRPLYENFIKMFTSLAPNVSVQASTDKSNSQKGVLQQIFYGAPGTGKSHTIKEETKEEDVIRITFHPDTDYSSFVGAYKPTTALLPICDELGQPMKIGSTVLHKEQIVYEFVAQSFLQAYVNAWKKYDKDDKQYLVIEEINRGNCAQIFGDLFQLLDRNDYGFSDYPIKADADMKRQLQKAFAGLAIEQSDKINAIYEGKDIVSQVLNGDILLLPNNLYIWATMNTSDQSLFPIDSAFKRRWDWTYMPISNAEKHWVIGVDGNNYDWWQFLEKINEKIGSTTNSEDKKLGYFFCKAQNGIISAKAFVGKVIFYLWNDVFKDYEFVDAIFNDVDGSKLSFEKFYTSEGLMSEIVEGKVELFLKNLKIEPIKAIEDENEIIEDEDGNTVESSSRNHDKFTVNDGVECGKNKLAIECIKEYIKLNPGITAQEVYNTWSSLGNIVPHFIESKEQYDARTDNSKRSDAIECSGSLLYIAHNGYGSNGKADTLMNLVNEKGWGITIKKIVK
jgi:hypothetical protein